MTLCEYAQPPPLIFLTSASLSKAATQPHIGARHNTRHFFRPTGQQGLPWSQLKSLLSHQSWDFSSCAACRKNGRSRISSSISRVGEEVLARYWSGICCRWPGLSAWPQLFWKFANPTVQPYNSMKALDLDKKDGGDSIIKIHRKTLFCFASCCNLVTKFLEAEKDVC